MGHNLYTFICPDRYCVNTSCLFNTHEYPLQTFWCLSKKRNESADTEEDSTGNNQQQQGDRAKNVLGVNS